MVGSSVLGTVSSTCFTGHSSSSLSTVFSFSESEPPSKVEAMVKEYFSCNTKMVLKVKSHVHVTVTVIISCVEMGKDDEK